MFLSDRPAEELIFQYGPWGTKKKDHFQDEDTRLCCVASHLIESILKSAD